MKRRVLKALCALCVSASITNNANAQFFPYVGGSHDAGAAIVGTFLAVTMSAIIQQMTAEERAKREAALRNAARSGNANWSTRGRDGKRAQYRRIASAKDSNNKCQKVEETITLADGKQAKSVENVCF